MLVPGNQEDLAGKPFVGPAGNLLDKVFAEAGIDRSKIYVTNAGASFRACLCSRHFLFAWNQTALFIHCSGLRAMRNGNDATPSKFGFSTKGPRFIRHMRRLVNVHEPKGAKRVIKKAAPKRVARDVSSTLTMMRRSERLLMRKA